MGEKMYNWDHKSLGEEKLRKNGQYPSFSSILLDEIYRSIDSGDEKSGEFKPRKEKVGKKQSVAGVGGCGGGRAKVSSVVEDEEMASLRRACLVEKWMEMKVNEKVMAGRRGPPSFPEFDRKSVLDNDPLFFSSGSSSSDSSFGWFSEPERSSVAKAKPKHSCFDPFNRLKHVKTSVSPHSTMKKQQNDEFHPFDDFAINHQTDKTDHGGLIKSKARALKIYANLKKVKQPISPGGRLTTFLNSLFTNGHGKKTKDSNSRVFEDQKTERKSKSVHGSTCSTASSFSRSCLSKTSQGSREKLNNGIQRTVRFLPVNVIIDQDSRPCGQKINRDQLKSEKFQCSKEKNQNVRDFASYLDDEKKNDFRATEIDNVDFDHDDMASDSSSDLFELDHLAIFRNEEFCQELPVYETTHFDTNRAIASGIIC